MRSKREKKKGIYKIINIINNKYYVGSTLDLYQRKTTHFRKLRINKHHCIHLQNAWNKYGEENFKFEIIEELNNLSLEEIRDIEQKYINNDFNNQYNIRKDVKCPNKNSQETKTRNVISRRKTKSNKTIYPGIKCQNNLYRVCIQIWGIRISLGSYKTLEEAIKVRKETEEYFWHDSIDWLSTELKQIIINQYITAFNNNKPHFEIKKSNSKYYRKKNNLFQVYYTLNKKTLFFSTHIKEEDAKKEVDYIKSLSSNELINYNQICRNNIRKRPKESKNYYYDKRRNKYSVYIIVNKKTYYYGYFDNEEEAIKIANKAKQELNIPI